MTETTVTTRGANLNEIAANAPGAKKTWVAYLLWFFLGYFGAHRFYVHRYLSACIMVGLTIFSSGFFLFTGFGIVTFSVVGIWLFVDMFLIPSMVREYNQSLIISITTTTTG